MESNTIRHLSMNEVEQVSGSGCGMEAVAGAMAGVRFGPKGALAGALIAGAFCVAGEYAGS